jgi:hypothetical protein
MKTIAVIAIILGPFFSIGQSVVGKWQLVKQSTCIENELDEQSENVTEDELVGDMKSRDNSGMQVLTFKEKNNTVEENTKIINKRKSYNSKSMLYKLTDTTLHILDKKSQTIIDSFTVEMLSADSLIISNVQRACDTKVFVKIK